MATTQSLQEAALALAHSRREADLDDLVEELRIPSISTLSERREDCLRNARWLRDRFAAMKMKTEIVDVRPGGLPVVMAEWNEWKSPPFDPTVHDGHLYARGAADNKGNHMVTVKAVEHLFASGGAPVNLRFLIEGEEEITGPSLPQLLRERGSSLKSDAVLIWDSGMDEEGMPTLATSLRGLIYTELHATGPAVDLHSGTFGGVAPNPINTLARIVGELKDRHGHITIPGFYDDVREPSSEEVAEWKKKEAAFVEDMLRITGARALEGEEGISAIARTGSRPTVDANGFIGGFTGKGAKTVIPAHASAKVSMRLVPDQDWKSILESFEKYVRSLSTPGVEISVEVIGSAPPVLCGVDHPAARALKSAYRAAFGKETALIRVGGSIPVAVDFQEAVGAPLVISGIAQADCAIHSPNEHLLMDNYHRGIEAVIRFICGLAPDS